MPTREEWLEEQERKKGLKAPVVDRTPNIVQGKKKP
jgi:hypothetical protein